MRDFLVQVASEAQAMAAMPQWTMIDPDSGKTVWKNPTWCGVLPVDAYTSVGAPAVYADEPSLEARLRWLQERLESSRSKANFRTSSRREGSTDFLAPSAPR